MKALTASFNVKHDMSGNIIFEPKEKPEIARSPVATVRSPNTQRKASGTVK